MTEHAAAPGWRLVEIAELVRRHQQLQMEALELLPSEACAEMPQGTDTEMFAADIERLTSIANESADIAEQVRHLAQSLPDEEVEIVYGDVCEAAAADLTDGMLDHERVLVAARVLDVRRGWPALAEGLRVVDIRDSWASATPRRTLSAFRGAGRALVSRALQAGGISSDAAYIDCAPEQLSSLADAIDELGGAWRS